MKHLFIVCYGGGHVRMVVPVVKELSARGGYRITILALTTAPSVLDQNGLKYFQFKDFFNIDDFPDARDVGTRLASTMHNVDAGIDQRESITYLGLSYKELSEDHGDDEAANLFSKYGRQCLLPVRSLEHIIDSVCPDMVITTNSPRAERAAVIAAKSRNIPTLSMVDLFGDTERYLLCADYITVFSESSRYNLIASGVNPNSIYVTGNPAFDSISSYAGPIDIPWRRDNLGISKSDRALLWAEKRSYMDRQTRLFHERSQKEIVADLDAILEGCSKNNILLLIRMHPSQKLDLFTDWINDKNPEKVRLANSYPLHPLINAVNYVGSFNSTVLVEAILVGRPIFQIDYTTSEPVLPLDTITKDIWVARSLSDIPATITSMCQSKPEEKHTEFGSCNNLPLNGAGNVADIIEKAITE